MSGDRRAQGAAHSPAILRQMLAQRLQELRESAGLSFDDVAEIIDKHHTTVRRMEKATVKVHPSVLQVLLPRYGLPQDDIDAWVELAKSAWKQRNWWDRYRLDEAVATAISLEEAAYLVRIYAPWRIPSLLRTPAYARALASPETADQEVELVARRQQVLGKGSSARGPRLWVVLDEPALRWRCGGAEVMAEQLRHLEVMAQRHRVTIQVNLFRNGPPPVLNAGAFAIFHLKETILPNYAGIETLHGVEVVHGKGIGEYIEAMDKTVARAPMTREENLAILGAIRTEWEQERE